MSYRRADEQPPENFHPLTDQAGQRIGEVFEVEPTLMSEHVQQQAMPLWDTHRIVASRIEHLEWMHRHWATVTLSGTQLLAELDHDEPTPATLFTHVPTTESSESPNPSNLSPSDPRS